MLLCRRLHHKLKLIIQNDNRRNCHRLPKVVQWRFTSSDGGFPPNYKRHGSQDISRNKHEKFEMWRPDIKFIFYCSAQCQK
uniref:Uncharacterized protein n=1 Tax=Spironucleus salmonicida TaxID=348837 RepID=V6LDG9_9EUKA|eukprot:EST42555.1 Hypothetical protein SS50377_17870 [Spironucleus salmonicida]